jgi:CheY-like chemotaxis protein
MITVFLADDDSDDRAFFEEAFTDLSMDIKLKSLNDGEELISTISEVITNPPPPHLVFLDLNMPRKNGFECLSEIKNNPRFKNIPIVIISTSTHSADIDRSYELGADAYIAKPNNLKDLRKLIKSVLDLKLWTNHLHLSKDQFVLSAQC